MEAAGSESGTHFLCMGWQNLKRFGVGTVGKILENTEDLLFSIINESLSDFLHT